MKIAYIVTRADPIGGAQVHVRDLAVSLRAQGHCPTVLTSGRGPIIEQLRAQGIPTIVLRHLSVPINPVRDLLALREIYAVLTDLRPDLLALHSSKAGILGRLAGRSLGIPGILTAHGWSFTPGIPPLQAAAYRQIERLVGLFTSKIITVSDFDRRLALEASITTEDRIVAVHNGIPDVVPSLRADPGRTPARLVMVARFGAQKDHPTLLRAMAGLLNHSWELDLIGEGPLMGEMRSLASTLGLDGRVRFLGQRTDVETLLSQAQISLLVSNWEGLPLSILEAMRAGLPVVATSTAGVGESVHEDETGYLVPRGNVETLRDRINRLLSDPGLRLRFGARGRAYYEKDFTLNGFVEKTLAVYREVLAAKKAP